MNRGYEFFRKLLPRTFRKAINRSPLRQSAQNYWILSVKQGQYRSITKAQPVDGTGNPIPWYTYPIIEYLHRLSFEGRTVFEYGSGNSSRFWANRAQTVTSVEDNPAWFNIVNEKKLSNQRILFAPTKDEYVNAISRSQAPYDLIIVDGEYREECAQQAVSHLKSDGIIILDNSDWFPEISEFLRQTGYLQIDFNGFGPINAYTWCTSLYIAPDFEINEWYKTEGPLMPIGGLKKL